MKSWISLFLALLLGIALGITLALSRISPSARTAEVYADRSTSTKRSEPLSKVKDETPPQGPRVAYDETTFDFGKMDTDEKGEHLFVLRNIGTKPLSLKKGTSTCKCTVGEPKKELLAPGESTEVVVNWDTKGYSNEYRQKAHIDTNDPEEPIVVFTITGKIQPNLTMIPRALLFGQILKNEEAQGQVRLYGFEDQKLEISDSWIKHGKLQNKVETRFRPLTAQELATVQEAKHGILLTVTIKPGLSRGPFGGQLMLETNYREDEPLEISISGLVGDEVSIFAPQWNESLELLSLGILRDQKEVKRTVSVLIQKPIAEIPELKIAEVVPANILHVELSEPKSVRNGSAVQANVTITIAKDAPAANYYGMTPDRQGRVVLETGNPDIGQIKIPIRFAIEK